MHYLAKAVILAALLVASVAEATPQLSYSDAFSDRYSTWSERALVFPHDTPLESKIAIETPRGSGRATLVRTDGAVVPYEHEEAHISITSELADSVNISAKMFRTISVTWVNERLLFIKRHIGHVAAIEELFDIVERQWVFQQSVHYRWP